MSYKVILVTLGILILIVGFILWQYIFNIYEVSVKSNKQKIYTDEKSLIKIKAFPLNAWGFRTPLREISADFEIMEGAELVEIVEKTANKFRLRSKGIPGKVTVKMESNRSLKTTLVEISILQR